MPGSTSGKIPEYTSADVNKWLSDQATNISNVTEIVLIFLPVLGFALFCAGIVQVAREGRESAAGMGGSSRRVGWWMVSGGGAIAVAGLILLYLIGFIRPASA